MNTVVFEALTPAFRPIAQLVLAVDVLGQIFLFVTHILTYLFVILAEVFQNISMLVDAVKRYTEELPVAVFFHPILDDREFSIVVEETVDIVDDHYIEVEEQCT